RIKRGVLDLGEWLEPVDALGFPAPEPFRILDRTLVHGGVSRAVDVSALAPFGGNFVDLLAHASTPRRCAICRAASFQTFSQSLCAAHSGRHKASNVTLWLRLPDRASRTTSDF